MLSGLQISMIVLMILLILTQTVSIRIGYSKQLFFEFNLTLFSFSYTIDDGSGHSQKRKRKAHVPAILRALNYALPRSNIVIKSLPVFPPEAIGNLGYGCTEILKYILLAYIQKNASSLTYYAAEDQHHHLDASVNISLYHLVTTFVLYFIKDRKSKSKARARI